MNESINDVCKKDWIRVMMEIMTEVTTETQVNLPIFIHKLVVALIYRPTKILTVGCVEKVRVLIADKCSVTNCIHFVKFPSDSSILDCEPNTCFSKFYVCAHLSVTHSV